MNITKRPRHLSGYYSRTIIGWLSRRRKLLTGALKWLGIPLAVIFLAGFVPISVNALKNTAQRAIVKAGATTCAIESLSLQPWLGLSAGGVDITINAGPSKISAKIPHVRLAWRIVPLLFKWVVIRDVIVDRPRLNVSLPPSTPGRQAPVQPISLDDLKSALPASSFSLAVQNISLRGAEVTIARKGRTVAGVGGMSLGMRIGYKKELTLSGKLSADSLIVGGLWTLRDMHASVRVNDRVATLIHCKADFYGGRLSAEGSADVGGGALERFSAELTHVSLQKIYEACRIGRGQCDGRLDGQVSFTPGNLTLDSLRGAGHVRLSDVSVHDTPLQRGILTFVAVPQVRNIALSSLAADLEIRDGKVMTPNILGEGHPLDVRAQGWVAFSGYFSEALTGIFDRDVTEKFHPVILNSLNSEPDGRKSFSFTIRGTLADPSIDIDRKITDRAVHNVIDEVRKFFAR